MRAEKNSPQNKKRKKRAFSKEKKRAERVREQIWEDFLKNTLLEPKNWLFKSKKLQN